MPDSHALNSRPPTAAAANDNQPNLWRTAFSGDNEWYTPSKYVEMARTVMGGIDVDPASNEIAQRTVRAATFYTADSDGLAHEWHGSVWMNPPFAHPPIARFCAKLVEELATGRAEQAVALTNNSSDTKWFATLLQAASSVCFTRGRIRWESPTRGIASPAMGQCFFYFGPGAARFREVFGEVGHVLKTEAFKAAA